MPLLSSTSPAQLASGTAPSPLVFPHVADQTHAAPGQVLDDAMKLLDKDNSGHVDYHEFVQTLFPTLRQGCHVGALRNQKARCACVRCHVPRKGCSTCQLTDEICCNVWCLACNVTHGGIVLFQFPVAMNGDLNSSSSGSSSSSGDRNCDNAALALLGPSKPCPHCGLRSVVDDSGLRFSILAIRAP
eukprot:355411-Chlamydomonas_euryale.AAC.3